MLAVAAATRRNCAGLSMQKGQGKAEAEQGEQQTGRETTHE